MATKGNDSHNLKFILALICYRCLLDFSYVFFVSKFYQYAGFKLTADFSAYSISWVLYLGCMFFTKSRITKVSDSFLLLAVLSVIAPVTSLYGLDERAIYPVAVTILSITMIYGITNANHSKSFRYLFLVQGRVIAVTASIVSVLALVVWVFVSGVTSNINLDFTKVYDFRETNTDILNVGIAGYLNSWVTKVFNMFVITFCLYKKRYILVSTFVLIQVLFFSVMAVKSVIFYPVMIIGIWYYFRKSDLSIIIPTLLSLVIFAAILSYVWIDDIRPASWFIRRAFFVPAHLTFTYFEFFADNPNVYWSNSIFSSFSEYPYTVPLSSVIGDFIGTGTNANNGYISSGYAHAGLFGVFIYSIILGVTLRILDGLCSSGIPLWMGVALTMVPFRSLLTNSDLLVTMMTHGFLLTVILLALIRTKNEKY